MDLILYMPDILKYFNIGLLSLLGVLVICGLWFGYRRGISIQTVRFTMVIISLFLSIYVAKLLYNTVMVWLDDQTTEDIILLLEQYGLNLSGNEFSSLLNYVDTKTLNYILAIPMALVIVPVAFVIIFITVSLLMLMVHPLLSKLFGFSRRRNNFLTRILGATLGVVQAVAVMIVLCAPLSGILTTASDVVYTMQEEAPEQEATVTITETYDEYIKPFAENKGVTLMSDFGGKLLYTKLTTLHLYEEKYEMTETISTPAIQIYAATPKVAGMNWQSLTEENKKGINAILDALEQSPYLSTLVADVLDSAATAYNDGAFVFTAEEDAAELLGAAISVFEGIDKDSLNPTLAVLRDAYYILSDENVIATVSTGNTGALSDLLTKKDATGQTVLSKVIAKLNSNQRTARLVTALTKLSISVMADSFGGNGIITEETYENVKEGINEILKIDKEQYADNPQGYIDAISDSLDTTLAENGIKLDEEIVDKMAEHVADNYSELDSLDDQQINDIILSYYNAYLESGNLPTDIPTDIPSEQAQ